MNPQKILMLLLFSPMYLRGSRVSQRPRLTFGLEASSISEISGCQKSTPKTTDWKNPPDLTKFTFFHHNIISSPFRAPTKSQLFLKICLFWEVLYLCQPSNNFLAKSTCENQPKKLQAPRKFV